jgi:hypothetical protein
MLLGTQQYQLNTLLLLEVAVAVDTAQVVEVLVAIELVIYHLVKILFTL